MNQNFLPFLLSFFSGRRRAFPCFPSPLVRLLRDELGATRGRRWDEPGMSPAYLFVGCPKCRMPGCPAADARGVNQLEPPGRFRLPTFCAIFACGNPYGTAVRWDIACSLADAWIWKWLERVFCHSGSFFLRGCLFSVGFPLYLRL